MLSIVRSELYPEVMGPDGERKRRLIEAWLRLHATFRVPLHAGGALDARRVHLDLAQHLGDRAHQDSLYVLVAADEPLRPLYIGKSKHPLHRWKQHLTHLARGEGVYARWLPLWERSLELYVIPDEALQAAPLPGFPVTVGSVEYQLIGLAQDAYDHLLNSDGVAR